MAHATMLLAVNAIFADEKTGALKSVYLTAQNAQGQRMRQSIKASPHQLPAAVKDGLSVGCSFIADVPTTETGAICAISSASSAIALGKPLTNAHSLKGFAAATEVMPEFDDAPATSDVPPFDPHEI